MLRHDENEAECLVRRKVESGVIAHQVPDAGQSVVDEGERDEELGGVDKEGHGSLEGVDVHGKIVSAEESESTSSVDTYGAMV